ncbi:hypothetical protein EC951288_3736B, partial [Escherichia coli 95.1288]
TGFLIKVETTSSEYSTNKTRS